MHLLKMESYDDFCGGPFWNATQFLAGSWPQFSACFVSVCLVWVPCGLLFLATPFYIVWLRHRRVTLTLPFSRMSAAKLTCQLSLIICTFVLILKRNGQTYKSKPPMSYVETVTGITKIVTFVLLVIFGQQERKKGVTASMIQFAFWTIYSLGQTIPAYSMVKLRIYDEDAMRFALFYLSFGLCVTLVFLNSWSEHPGLSATRRGYLCIDEQDPCPLEAASALLSLTFSWTIGLLRAGYTKTLDESSMWAVPQDISSDEISGQFDAIWKEELSVWCGDYAGGSHSYGMLYTRQSLRDQDSSDGGSTCTIGSSNISQNSNSFSGSIVSKATVMENVMYTERTRLTTKQEIPHCTTYTQLIQHNFGQDTKNGITRKKLPSLLRSLWKLYRTDLVLIAITKLFGDAFIVAVPLILRYFLMYLQTGRKEHNWQGYGLSVLFLVTLQFQSVLSGRCHLLAIKTGISVKTVLSTAVYKKVLSLKSNKNAKTDTEDSISLISVDCVHLQEFLTRVSQAFTIPLLIVMCIIVSYVSMGASAVLGVASLCILVPIHLLMSLVQTEFKNKMALYKEIRLRVLQEIVRGIKVLKLFAWEVPFQSKVQGIRSVELASLLKLAYCYMVTGIMNSISVYLAALVMFTVYVWSDGTNEEGPGIVFMVLAYIGYLRKPLEDTANFLYLSVKTYKACTRIQQFLLREELSEDAVTVTPGAEHPVMLERVQLRWDYSSSFKLKSISLTVPQESLVAVVGLEGCGKSSLLSAILGEMDRVRGKASRRGTVAYVSQDPWIQNNTLRENILFGKVYRERKVKAVMSACQLEDELISMDVDEDTIIGQHGIHLDYSQEKRLCLARALYHDCDLYLLDEPLGGLGPSMAWTVFNNVMGPRGLLKNTTRIMATNFVHVLPAVDTIVVMRQGRIVEVGSYDELMSHDGALVQFLKERMIQDKLDGWDCEDNDDDDEEISSIKDAMWDRVEKLTTSDCTATSGDEGRSRQTRDRTTIQIKNVPTVTETGGTLPQRDIRWFKGTNSSKSEREPLTLYKQYIASIGTFTVVCGVVILVLHQCSWVLGNLWVAQWSCDKDLRNESTNDDQRNTGNEFYIIVFVLFGVGQFLFLGCFHYLFWTSIVRHSGRIHDVMIARLFRAPLAFFNATPLGNMVKVFVKDLETVDHHLPHNTRELMSTIVQLVATALVIIATTPLFIVILLLAVIISAILVKVYLPTSRTLCQLSQIAQSPIANHFGDTLNGTTTIRAFHAEERFLKEFSRHLDRNNSYHFAVNITYRWIILHLSTLSNLIVFITSVFQVVSPSNDPGLSGVTILFALQLSMLLGRLVSLIANIENDIGSMDRLRQYSEIPQEKGRENSDTRLPANWPFPGNIEFHEFSTGDYTEESKRFSLIRDVRAHIDGGEKIGVVSLREEDRTGFPLSLFRLVERTTGTIFIDGVDISSIGLNDLRSRLTILPQDPSLFSGSIRFNLDPLHEFKDDQIWSCLARVYLKPYIAQLAEQLAFEIGENGENLSVGHRRLLCVARTLLRKTNILVVEEPSALTVNDTETEHFINNIIHMAFRTCTTITVTHKPQSVINCDRVLVIEDGVVKEFDSPVTLLNNPASTFYSMARDAGLAA